MGAGEKVTVTYKSGKTFLLSFSSFFCFFLCVFSGSLMAFSREVWLQQESSLFHGIQVLCHVW